MEEKKVSKDDEKKDLSLEKILKIEEAYFDLMKAYSKCLTSQKIEGADDILSPRFISWKIRKQIDVLWMHFLLLIAQNRNKIDSDVIKRFEINCEDLDKLSAQCAKLSFYDAIFPVVAFSVTVVLSLLSLPSGIGSDIFKNVPLLNDPLVWGLIVFLGYSLFYYVVVGFGRRKRLFRENDVPRKEKKIFDLIQEYLEIV